MPRSMDCVKCGGRMEDGFIVDRAHSTAVQSQWVAGEVEDEKVLGIFWAGVKMRGKVIRAVQSYRCARCGYLESYAVEEQGDSVDVIRGRKGRKS